MVAAASAGSELPIWGGLGLYFGGFVLAGSVVMTAWIRPGLFLGLFLALNAADLFFISSHFGLPGITDRVYPSDLLLAGMVFAWVLRRTQHTPAERAPLTWPIVLFMAIGGANIVRGAMIDPFSAFGDGRFVLYPVAYFCAFDASLDRRPGPDLPRLLTVLATVIAVVGIVVFALEAKSLKSTPMFPGKLSVYALFGLVFLGAGVVRFGGRWRLAAIGAQALMILFSGVRTTLVLFPLLALAFRGQVRRGLLIGSVLVGLVGVGLLAFQGEGSGLTELYGDAAMDPEADPSLRWRLEYWADILEHSVGPNLPFGVGIWGYLKDLRLPNFEGEVSDSPHNCFLLLLVYGGLPLFLGYLGFIVMAYRRYREARWQRLGDTDVVARMALFVLLCTQVAIGFNAEHRGAGPWPMMWLLLGYFDAQLERRARAESSATSRSSAASAALPRGPGGWDAARP